jgi:hypothetical protein
MGLDIKRQFRHYLHFEISGNCFFGWWLICRMADWLVIWLLCGLVHELAFGLVAQLFVSF